MNSVRRQRGSALVGAVAIAVIAAMSLGVALALSSSYNRGTYLKTDSESALLIAEAGVNDELNKISSAFATGQPVVATAPIKLASEPYAGRKGEVAGAAGTYWVYTSADADGQVAWDGTSPFYITCNSLVNGSWRRVKIGGPNYQPFQSPFANFAVFGYDSASGSSRPNIGLTGNAVVEITGVTGVNGRVDGGAGTITFTQGVNYNTGSYSGTSHEQLNGSKVYEKSEKLVLPTVVDVIRQTVPATAKMTDVEAWAYVKANNNNVNGVKMWRNGLKAGAVLSPATIISANWPSSGGGAYNLTNTSGSALGRWESRNLAPGSTAKRTLIFQPGDYYLEAINLDDNVNTELIIDTAGLTLTGGNPNRTPVRFFVNGTGRDTLKLEIKQTDTSDSAGLRIYYGKPGGEFDITRPSSAASGEDWTTKFGVYAVTTNASGGNGTEIMVTGGASPGWLTIKGSLIADRVGFQQRCRIISPGDMMIRSLDPISGVGFAGGYSDG
ncbi:MAG: hypothetical protein ACAH95_05135 [Fimbriimonas sp.]